MQDNGNDAVKAITKVRFHGDDLDVIQDGDDVYVSVRRVCEALGLAHQGQFVKLEQKAWAVVTMIVTTGPDGRNYKTFCIHLDSLTMWLATIESARVAEAMRPKLINFQIECARTLHDRFFGKPTHALPTEPLDIGPLMEAIRRELASSKDRTLDVVDARFDAMAREVTALRADQERLKATLKNVDAAAKNPERFDSRAELGDSGGRGRAVEFKRLIQRAATTNGVSFARVEGIFRREYQVHSYLRISWRLWDDAEKRVRAFIDGSAPLPATKAQAKREAIEAAKKTVIEKTGRQTLFAFSGDKPAKPMSN